MRSEPPGARDGGESRARLAAVRIGSSRLLGDGAEGGEVGQHDAAAPGATRPSWRRLVITRMVVSMVVPTREASSWRDNATGTTTRPRSSRPIQSAIRSRNRTMRRRTRNTDRSSTLSMRSHQALVEKRDDVPNRRGIRGDKRLRRLPGDEKRLRRVDADRRRVIHGVVRQRCFTEHLAGPHQLDDHVPATVERVNQLDDPTREDEERFGGAAFRVQRLAPGALEL